MEIAVGRMNKKKEKSGKMNNAYRIHLSTLYLFIMSLKLR